MGIHEELNQFINKFSTQKGKPYTNTSIGHPKKSLCVPDDKYSEFIRIYSLAITNGIHLYFTEKPLNPSPLRIDLDFRFILPYATYDFDTNELPVYKRIYTNNHIDTIIKYYNEIITKSKNNYTWNRGTYQRFHFYR